MCIIVMHLVMDLFVMDLMLVLIFWILVALFEGVITLWSVRGAGLECLVTMIRRNLVLLFLFAFVVIVAAVAVVATLPLVVLMIVCLVMPATAAVTSMTLFHDTMDLLLIMLLEGVAKLAFFAKLDLALTFLCKGAIGYLGVEDILKVFCNRLKCLIAKVSSTLNVLCAILRVERHVEPLKL
jgi:hypothetical protein